MKYKIEVDFDGDEPATGGEMKEAVYKFLKTAAELGYKTRLGYLDMDGAAASDDGPRAADATTIAGVWPKLTAEQREWVEGLSADERRTLEDICDFHGEAYVLSTFRFMMDQLEFVRSL